MGRSVRRGGWSRGTTWTTAPPCPGRCPPFRVRARLCDRRTPRRRIARAKSLVLHGPGGISVVGPIIGRISGLFSFIRRQRADAAHQLMVYNCSINVSVGPFMNVCGLRWLGSVPTADTQENRPKKSPKGHGAYSLTTFRWAKMRPCSGAGGPCNAAAGHKVATRSDWFAASAGRGTVRDDSRSRALVARHCVSPPSFLSFLHRRSGCRIAVVAT